MGIINEKVAVISGAGSGMGREEVILLAKKEQRCGSPFRYNDEFHKSHAA